jgi:C-terminal processing protease CtpA/Prc
LNIKRDLKTPLLIITNQQTASAAEVFVASLQGISGILICGQRTFGKDSAQVLSLNRTYTIFLN